LNDELIAVGLTDVLADGLSMVYSFFDPDLERHSLGTYLILDHIRIAQEANLPYVYLGYWVPGSQKMGYKANFAGLEIFTGGRWQPVPDPSKISADMHPLSNDPISEQVANIRLPGIQSAR
jgi:arginyl-tRNA--protein-N-Asp/Glu arginylyltransferase